MIRGWRLTSTILVAFGMIFLMKRASQVNGSLDDISINELDSDGNRSPYSRFGPNAMARSALVERQERLQMSCDEISKNQPQAFDELDPEAFKNLLVDEKHQLLYCYVPKV